MKKMCIKGNDGCIIERSLKMPFIVTAGVYKETQQMFAEADTRFIAETIAKEEAKCLHLPFTVKVYQKVEHTKPRLIAEYQGKPADSKASDT